MLDRGSLKEVVLRLLLGNPVARRDGAPVRYNNDLIGVVESDDSSSVNGRGTT